MLTTQLDSLISRSKNTAINITARFSDFSFDMMGWMAFSEKFDLLKTGQSHHMVNLIEAGLVPVGFLTPVPWLFLLMASIPGVAQGWFELLNLVKNQTEKRIQKVLNKGERKDIMYWMIDSIENGENTTEDMKDSRWLYGEALNIIIAGSGTVAAALTFLFYHLVEDAAMIDELREELKDMDDHTLSSENLRNLPYLNALISETLRLYPGVPSGSSRLSPPEGMTVAGQFIPGGVTLLLPAYSLNRLESCFEKPCEFIPERWTSAPELIKKKSAYYPFSLGTFL